MFPEDCDERAETQARPGFRVSYLATDRSAPGFVAGAVVLVADFFVAAFFVAAFFVAAFFVAIPVAG